jgi:hypothetical protein
MMKDWQTIVPTGHFEPAGRCLFAADASAGLSINTVKEPLSLALSLIGAKNAIPAKAITVQAYWPTGSTAMRVLKTKGRRKSLTKSWLRRFYFR